MVLHGDRDPLVNVSGGRRTAELVPGAELRILAGMGHDMPPSYWDRIVGGLHHITTTATITRDA
jgi:pimeloyl-ACP methyl ester carboxylesterase